MKKFIFFFILLILIFLGYLFYIFYFSDGKVAIEGKILATELLSVKNCFDSDEYNIATNGYATWEDPKSEDPLSNQTIYESCNYRHTETKERVGLLTEYVCEGNTLKAVLLNCNEGFVCRYGACVEGDENTKICTDSDTGIDMDTAGFVRDGSGSNSSDICWRSSGEGKQSYPSGTFTSLCTGDKCFVKEYYCSDIDKKEYELIPCYSCQEGRCIKGQE